MTAEIGEALRAEAIRWHVRIGDAASAEDWEAFTDWLAADPEHARAYDEIEALDALIGSVASAMPPFKSAANDDDPVRATFWWFGGAAAAAVALAVLIIPNAIAKQKLYRESSGPGATRTIALASGDKITLNGDSSVTLDHKNVRFARLERGEGTFGIMHNSETPFIVEVGGERIQDAGTVFDVVRSPDGVRVAVATGSVIYNPDREALRLGPGQLLRDPGGAKPVVLARVDAASVGSWQRGRLSYDDAPLTEVAADIARATGEHVRVDPALAARQFTGSILLRTDRKALFVDIARLLDVDTPRQ